MVDEGRAIMRGREGRGRAGGRVPSMAREDPERKDGVWLGHLELEGPRGRHSTHAAGYGTVPLGWRPEPGWPRAPSWPQAKPPRSYYFCLDFGLK